MVQRAGQDEAAKERIAALRQELQAERAAYGDLHAEQLASLRRETERAIRDEREARQWEMTEMRSKMDALQVKVTEYQAHQAPHPNALREHTALAEVQCCLGDLSRRLDELRASVAEEVNSALRHMEMQYGALEKGLELEVAERSREFLELRGILDSVWLRTTKSQAANTKYFLKYKEEPGPERYKEFVGDQEDINTLYEMVREALGDTVHLRQQISQEKDLRIRLEKQTEHLEKQLNTVQALVRELTPSASRQTSVGTPVESSPCQSAPSTVTATFTVLTSSTERRVPTAASSATCSPIGT